MPAIVQTVSEQPRICIQNLNNSLNLNDLASLWQGHSPPRGKALGEMLWKWAQVEGILPIRGILLELAKSAKS